MRHYIINNKEVLIKKQIDNIAMSTISVHDGIMQTCTLT